MTRLAFPTSPTARIMQKWGNANSQMYANGRHMGLDLGGLTVGAPIYAVCEGVVETVNLGGAHGYGRHVIIEHDGFKTLYAHLHKVFVVDGSKVGSGGLIGEMGGDPGDDDKIDGASTGTHLHFEVILPNAPEGDCIKTFAGYTVDPFPYLLQRYGEPVLCIGHVVEKSGVRVRPVTISGGSNYFDTLLFDVRVEIVETKPVLNDTWARLRSLRTEWVCVNYQGREYLKLEPVPNPPASGIPPEGGTVTVDEKAIRIDEVNRLIKLLEDRKGELQ